MTKKQKEPSRLTRELEGMSRALHRLGALSDDEDAKITAHDLAQDKIGRAGHRRPPSH